MPLARRLPKRGFHNLFRKTFQLVNLGSLSGFEAGATVDLEALAGKGLIRLRGGAVKLLGRGEAPKNLTIHVHAASASARKKIEDAGGKVEKIG